MAEEEAVEEERAEKAEPEAVEEKEAVEKKEVETEATEEKRKKKAVSLHYRIEGEKLERLLPFCERCGPGYFMADHGDRYTCGHCSFTRYKREETSD